MTQLRLAPNTADEVVIDTDAISSADFAKTHTGLSDYRITIERGLGVHDYALDELWLEQDDGTLLFRGLLESIDEQAGNNVTPTATLSGKGVGYKLDRSSALVEVTKPTFAADVIRNFWSDETPFSATVTDPTPANSVTDQTAQEANTNSEFTNITSPNSDDPVAVQNDNLELLQSSFTTESNNLTRSSTNLITGNEYSNGEAEEIESSIGSLSLDFTLDYTIPESAVEAHVRLKSQGGGIGPGLELSLNGDTWQPVSDAAGFGSIEWRDLANETFGTSETYSGGDLTAGAYTLTISGTTSGDGQIIDVVAPLDGRFNYTFDNSITSGERVEGPELYPDSFAFAFDAVDTPWNITNGALNTSWNNTENSQQIQLRLSGQTYFPNDGTEDNTESITTDFGDELGQTIQGRATFSRYGNRTAATPQTGFNGQNLNSWEIRYDGNDNPIISAGETFEGTQLDVAQRLHSRADMRFVLSHSKDSLPANSFRAGDQTQPLPDVTINRKTTRTDLSNFFNQVEVLGQRDENGDRIKHLEDDQDAINAYGEQYWAEYDPSLETQEGVESKARAILNEKLRELSDKGELNVAPVDIAPGYSYNNPFDTGDETVPLEEISYRITNGEISGQLVFDFRTGAKLASDISGLRVNTRDSALGF
jgi:hypothetical protein